MLNDRTIPHHEWLRLLDIRFPPGKNPWHDIYDVATTKHIGTIIGISDDDGLFRLRSALAQAAEVTATFPIIFGGINSESSKRQWMQQTTAKLSALLKHLQGAEDFSPEFLVDPDFQKNLRAARQNLEGMQTAVENALGTPTAKARRTLDSDYLQFLVDRLTEVFALFKPATDIKRSFADGVYGTFPDFIRATAKPYLLANHEKFRLLPARYEKLDRQIQNAIARSNGNYEQYHRKR